MPLPARLQPDHYKPKARLRSTAHRDWVRGHYCSVPGCAEMPIEVAHINRASTRGMSQKSSDAQTVALCRAHHDESHRGEKSFEKKYGLDLMAMAREFYRASPHRRKLDDPWGER
ncbi:putative HNHc nuclease [Sphingomicrobium sp. XHP0235]|uniref:DUF968 domain-containing protein n=1 Tax=Sphingomicrobium aquimarinum TaxID=3133971 RepID=UPI0031FEE202